MYFQVFTWDVYQKSEKLSSTVLGYIARHVSGYISHCQYTPQQSLSFYFTFFPPFSGKPIIAEPDIGKVSKQGEQVTLKCVAHGEPKPQFTWVPSAKEVHKQTTIKQSKNRPIIPDFLDFFIVPFALNLTFLDIFSMAVRIKNKRKLCWLLVMGDECKLD